MKSEKRTDGSQTDVLKDRARSELETKEGRTSFNAGRDEKGNITENRDFSFFVFFRTAGNVPDGREQKLIGRRTVRNCTDDFFTAQTLEGACNIIYG